MKLCVTASGQSLDEGMDPRFGRCRYFIIVDADTLQFEAVQNPAIDVGGGAGIKAAQFVADQGVETVLTGHIGPHAYEALTAAGIKVVAGLTGITVRQAVEAFKTGKQGYVSGPSVNAHYGTGGGYPAMGRGRGMRMCRGRGLGRR